VASLRSRPFSKLQRVLWKWADELDVIIKKLYESFAVGRISDERFDSLLAEYEAEQKTLRSEPRKRWMGIECRKWRYINFMGYFAAPLPELTPAKEKRQEYLRKHLI
jgi:hypothetical protein